MRHNANLLQQVRVAPRPRQPTAVVELQLRKLAEPRRVVVAQGLGVTEALQQRVRGDHLDKIKVPRVFTTGEAGVR